MDEAKTPEQVKKVLAADWVKEGLKYHDIAQITGYKYQTIANLISEKKTYFKAEQAEKFEPMGYRIEFLMFGTGCLKKEDDIESAVGKVKNSMHDEHDDFKLAFLLSCFKNIADIYDDSLMQVIYKKFLKAITTEDRHTSAECIAEIQKSLALAMMTHKCVEDTDKPNGESKVTPSIIENKGTPEKGCLCFANKYEMKSNHFFCKYSDFL